MRFFIFFLLICLNGISQEVCLTPNEYRFYAGAVIDRQAIAKDTVRLKEVISDLKANNASLEADLVKSRNVEANMYEKEAIYTHKINLLHDDVDKYKGKTVRNRKIAVGGGVSVVLEAIIIAGLIYFR